MDGWQHTTRDFDRATDGDEEAWARAIALEGWTTWYRTGVWLTVGSRRVRRWALRRPCSRPWSAHEHAERCLIHTQLAKGTTHDAGANPDIVPG